MVNVVVVQGKVFKEPEVVTTHSGESILKFSIGVPPYKGKSDWQYFDVACFGKNAEVLERIVKPGCELVVTGYLKQSRWETKDGSKRSHVSIVCNKVDITKWPKGEEGEGDAGAEEEPPF